MFEEPCLPVYCTMAFDNFLLTIAFCYVLVRFLVDCDVGISAPFLSFLCSFETLDSFDMIFSCYSLELPFITF